jgi:Carboxypeptidase regulatory-like domain
MKRTPSLIPFVHRGLWSLLLLGSSCPHLLAAATGSLSGTLKDPSGALVAGDEVTLVNAALKFEYRTVTNGQGFYSFPTLPVGHYDLTIEATGFKTQKRSNLMVDTDAALKLDAILVLGERSEQVSVEANGAALEAQVDTVATHLGELVTGSQMTGLPLNGRSYTDLLPIQPGVAPASTLLPNSVIMAGVTGGLSPSGDLNPGNLSIDG